MEVMFILMIILNIIYLDKSLWERAQREQRCKGTKDSALKYSSVWRTERYEGSSSQD